MITTRIFLCSGAAVLAAGVLSPLAWPQRDSSAVFKAEVRPVVERYCLSCHSEALQSGNLNLESQLDAATAASHSAVWRKVLARLAADTMPPQGMPRPSEQERAAVTGWLEGLVGGSVVSKEARPGRVTARRLNRVEYNNTIRDLLGVHATPADDFPVDDSGYGFDNVGDVLTVSPMLMEKYLAAARQVSRLAIFGPEYPKEPTVLTRLLPKRSFDAASGGLVSRSGYLPFSLRGALYGSFVFPVDGEYELRVRIANYRGQDPNDLPPEVVEARRIQREQRRNRPPGQRRVRRVVTPEEIARRDEEARLMFPPEELVTQLDGKTVMTDYVEGSSAFAYSRGEFTVRVPATAGNHTLRASFPGLANLDDPWKNVNPDQRRKLYVDYLDIFGPFDPTEDPPDSYGKVFVCGHRSGNHVRACAREAVENLARRAYRRPVTEAELQSKLQLVELARSEGDSVEEGVRLALEAILVSPNFLFRIERDSTSGESPRRLNDYELATRLSFFLWASTPDDELLSLAAAGRLHDPGVIEAQTRRMMADPRAVESLVKTFAAQWLQLRNFGRTKPDPERFKNVDDELLDAMRRETELFIEEIFTEDHSILDLIDAPFTYLNGPLARHYSIQGVDGEEFRRVELDGIQRGGLLTQGAILTVSSYPTRTSIPVRGKWVLENLLGTPPPAPPAEVPPLDVTNVGENVSLRERVEQHRADPNCSGCHNLMDPIGFGLENYNAVGEWRTHDGSSEIDASGTLPSGKSFQGAQDLKKILREESDVFTRNLTEKMLTYALGRGLEPYDRLTVDEIVKQAADNDYRFSAIVQQVVKSMPFQMRGNEGD